MGKFQKAREEVRTALGGMSNSLSPYLVAHVYLKGNLPPNIEVLLNSPLLHQHNQKYYRHYT